MIRVGPRAVAQLCTTSVERQVLDCGCAVPALWLRCFLLPVALGVVSWIALFGSDQEEQAEGHLEPALRLVGIVGF